MTDSNPSQSERDATAIDPDARKLERAQEIIRLYWYEEKPFAEIADILEVSIGTLSNTMDDTNIPRKPLSEQRADNGALRWDTERLQYLDWLTPKQQQTIREFYFEQKSAQEIADTEGISREWLYTRISNTVERLEEIAADQSDWQPRHKSQ